MSRLAVALVALAVLLAGCVSVSVGAADVPAISYFVLADARPLSASPQATGTSARLAIQAIGADPFADSTAIVYSPRAGQRAVYQFASWTERPSQRLAQLAQQRLQARARFAVVTQLGQPVDSDWLLSITLESLVHDVSSTPGRAQLALRAELIHRRDRSLVAQRAFTAASPVAEAAAPEAVGAFAVATADVLDLLVDWVEATVTANAKR
jgi:ABC-type uncharacterized transport system auxiliary subunit